jgi:hypothetical protein
MSVGWDRVRVTAQFRLVHGEQFQCQWLLELVSLPVSGPGNLKLGQQTACDAKNGLALLSESGFIGANGRPTDRFRVPMPAPLVALALALAVSA